jgi:hypothetical protein
MIKPSVKVKIPHIEIDTPDSKSFWSKVGIELVNDIGKRTRSGKDADNKTFRKYEPATVKQRLANNRTANVNLTYTGKMLGAMSTGIKPSKHGVRIQLSGEQGMKAWNIKFNQQRNFFAFNDSQVKRIIKLIKAYIKRKNK